jgi:hypothetical protein
VAWGATRRAHAGPVGDVDAVEDGPIEEPADLDGSLPEE